MSDSYIMRIIEPGEKQRLDGLSFTNTFPEDYLPYTSSYHRKAPYLVWEDRNTTHRKYKRRKLFRLCTKGCPSCSCSTAAIAVVFTVGLVILFGAVTISVYLGWLTHTHSPTGLSLTGKLRVMDGDQFSPSLLNTSSEDFRNKAAKYEQMLQSVYNLSKLKNSLTRVEVYAFHEGSLDVYFHLHLQNIKKKEEFQNLTEVAREILIEEAENAKSNVFQGIRVDTFSIQLLDATEPFQEESKVETSAMKYDNIPENSTVSIPELKASQKNVSEEETITRNTSSSDPIESNHSHHVSNSTFMFSYGQWRPVVSTEPPQATDRIITPPATQSFHTMFNPGNIEFHPSTVEPATQKSETVFSEIKDSDSSWEGKTITTVRRKTATSTVKPKEVIRPLRQSGVVLQSPSLRLLSNNMNRTSTRNTILFLNANDSGIRSTSNKNYGLENINDTRNFSAAPLPTSNKHGTYSLKEERSENLPEISLGVPLVIKESINAQTNQHHAFRKIKVGNTVLETTRQITVATMHKNRNATLTSPINISSPILHLKNNKHISNSTSVIELPAETSLKITQPSSVTSSLGVGAVVGVLTNENNQTDQSIRRPTSNSVPSGWRGSVTSVENKQQIKQPKLDTSTELTIGASLFIRNSKQNRRTSSRPNLPFVVTKHSNLTASSALNDTIKHLFQEPVLTAPLFIRGSNRGTAYISLSPDRTNSERNNSLPVLRPIDTELRGQFSPGNDDRRFFVGEETMRASKNFQFDNGSSFHPNERNPVGKIISQHIPGKVQEDAKNLQNHNSPDEIKSHRQSLTKHNRPYLSSTEKPKKAHTSTPLVQDVTTVAYGSSSLSDNSNDILDYSDTTVKQPTVSSTTVINRVTTESAVKEKKCVPLEEFTCITGSCIPLSKFCDRHKDCPDASDEVNCTCSDYMRTRVFKSKLCDGVVDCWDYSDEKTCAWCSVEQFICPGAKQCYPQSKVCDGFPDCPGGEDELNCVKLVQNMDGISQHSYSTEGYVAVRKDGEWGKLCMDSFPLSVEDVGKAVCNSMSYKGLIFAKKMLDIPFKGNYFQLGSSLKPTLHQLQGTSMLSPTDCSSKEVLQLSCKSLECGLQPLSSAFRKRIVGGFGASLGSWPWQVALYKEGDFQCGAVIINEHWLISAGHCFYHSRGAHWTARLGLLRRGSEIPSPYEQIHNITHIFLHPLYVDRGFINDIALLRMEKQVYFSDQVRPICLPENIEFKSWEGQMCTVIGWGKLFEVGRIFPDTLQEVQLPLISTEECRKRTLFLPLYKITDNMFCAGFERGGRDACLGDSGGPFMCQRPDGRWTLIGVTSNGDGCGRPGRPGVYTKIVNYLDWIQSVIGNNVIPTTVPNNCEGHRCLLGRCLPKEKICDGVMDCWDDSDEIHCQV